MTSRNFPELDESSAPLGSRGALARARARFGTVPTPLARYASSPGLIEHAEISLAAFDRTSLAPLEREVVALTVARRNGCDFCLRLHRGLLRGMSAPDGFFESVVSGAPLEDERLEALRAFTRALLERAGDVDEEVWQAFLARGFSREQALEVVVGVGAYTLTTIANRLTQSG